MTEKTRDNLEKAFVGEAKAYFRLTAFAKKAQEEGYPQVARLFRAVAAAEGVHAGEHFALLEKVKSTEENLKSSFEKETFVNKVAYPAFLKDAWADGDRSVIGGFTKARNAEERHAKLYKRALTDMTIDRDTRYFVCTNCGWIEDGRKPEECPNCQSPAEAYREVR
ncbi:MAG TPA: rubrerythrin family protein [Syntrophales bacterium]|jgi:rubrerythrin|nr:rubrerythrin family protein [Syntrophales bacterium]HRT61547.1 rubrerythrin family protein [Syntrophales bacterium]